MIQVLLVDDHQIILNGLKSVIDRQDDMVVAGEAKTAEACLELLQESAIDVILMDINLPGMDGMDLCKEVIKKWPEKQVIGLTTYDQVSFIEHMVDNGARGYLFKDTDESELLQAIRCVYRGEEYFSSEVYRKLVTRSKGQGYSSFIPKLTRREKEVLSLVAEEFTNQEIAERLFLSLSTIETHRMNLCAKMDVRNTAGLIKKAIKLGLV